MQSLRTQGIAACLLCAFLSLTAIADEAQLSVAGLTVTPHTALDSMRYRHSPEPAVGARVQLFLRNDAAPDADPFTMNSETRIRFNDKSPDELLAKEVWSWHDTPAATPDESYSLPTGAMTVWTFNSRTAPYGPGSKVQLIIGTEDSQWLATEIAIKNPACWLSAITFLSSGESIYPDTLVAHIANETDLPVEIQSCRLWLPKDAKSPRVLYQQPPLQPIEPFNGHAAIPAGDRGGFIVKTPPLPLTYGVIELTLSQPNGDLLSLWGHLRIKPEHFDISGGWVNGGANPVSNEVFLKALKRLHVNTAHLAHTVGYSDTDLYERYPLKYFNRLTPFETYDTDEMLPRIHAVEFLGEPQYGGGRPVPPQEVWIKLHPYAATRLPTSITHSEERIWRDYAGLSDYPHYDAYRVTAPSADIWRKYDRWGKRIGWGAPLETIGDMCRSLRELNRPMPCAIWSQGPHEGWEVYGGRKRTSPTPDEIRLQAYHAASTRITSLYWFNLSLKTLVMWRDTLDEVGRIGRELRMLEEFMLEGDAYRFERLTNDQGELDWDIASLCGPRAALLYALDLHYTPDPEERVFKFGPPRAAEWQFDLPGYLPDIRDVFRVDSEGIHEVEWSPGAGGVRIAEKASRIAVYVASPDTTLRDRIEHKRQTLISEEEALQFDPFKSDADFALLEQLAEPK